FRRRFGYPEITPEMKRKVLGLNSARLYGMSPDVTRYSKVPDDYHRRLLADAELLKTMEYDDRLPNEVPANGSPKVDAYRTDRFEQLRAGYREAADGRFGVPHSNHRSGWIRVR
ncbi:MAG: hypothetical protein LC792_17100, partial [Actinobacteria bacterium]|nr:hypothetical protein [Actinomycetota bacterium]